MKMDSSIEILQNHCQLCKKLSEFLFKTNDTCVIYKVIKKNYIPKTILRGSKLCKECYQVVKSKIRSKRYAKCVKCKCNYEIMDIYGCHIIQNFCPICKFQYKHCSIHEYQPVLFRQNEKQLPCYKCTKSVILRTLLMNFALFLISPFLIFFEGINGVEKWPCFLQAVFFLFLPLTIPIAIIMMILSKLLQIFYTIICYIQLEWSKKQQSNVWFV